mmetsp:Transcript_20679/g.22982  ORF Transcript_20679/g.22982 Transcript_20679/m.22982 type:complete len:271 (-) Transcript_20679:79-891(-)
MFIKDETSGNISLANIRQTLRQVVTNRNILLRTLNSKDDITKVLRDSLGVLAWLATAVACLFIFEVDYEKVVVPFISALVAISFAFGKSAREAFDGFIFLFVVNPFDVGDAIATRKFNRLVVEKISLLSTTAVRPDGRRIILSNFLLKHEHLTNYSKSHDHVMIATLEVDFETPKKKLRKLRKGISQYLELYGDIYKPNFLFNYIEASDQNSLIIEIRVTILNTGWRQTARFLERRNNIYSVISTVSHTLGIKSSSKDVHVKLKNDVSES